MEPLVWVVQNGVVEVERSMGWEDENFEDKEMFVGGRVAVLVGRYFVGWGDVNIQHLLQWRRSMRRRQ